MKTVVSIIKAIPEEILDSYYVAMQLADCFFPPTKPSLNYIIPQIVWERFLPGCSTMPWQLEGAILSVLSQQHHYKSIKVLYGSHVNGQTRSAYKHDAILDRFGFKAESLERNFQIHLKPTPLETTGTLMNPNFIFLSSGKCHVIHHLAGAYWALLNTLMTVNGEVAESFITNNGGQLYRSIEPLLKNSAYVLDLTIAGDGPGPHCIRPRFPGYIMASRNPLALDMVFGTLIGANPANTPLLKLAHNMGLSPQGLEEIEIVGEKLRDVEPNFEEWIIPIPGGLVARMERQAINNPESPGASFARMVRERLWYPLRGVRRAQAFSHNEWGFLWQCF